MPDTDKTDPTGRMSWTDDPSYARSAPAAQPTDLAPSLGRAVLGVLVARFGTDRAEAFARALSAPTFPGTPERAAQDAAYERLCRRLVAAQGEE